RPTLSPAPSPKQASPSIARSGREVRSASSASWCARDAECGGGSSITSIIPPLAVVVVPDPPRAPVHCGEPAAKLAPVDAARGEIVPQDTHPLPGARFDEAVEPRQVVDAQAPRGPGQAQHLVKVDEV